MCWLLVPVAVSMVFDVAGSIPIGEAAAIRYRFGNVAAGNTTVIGVAARLLTVCG